MADQAAAQAPGHPNYHVLLIGIDDYPRQELQGCVNDIDAVQRVLLHKLGVPPARIHRLASPRPDTRHDSDVASAPATLDHMRAALTRLGSDEVAGDDRVFIYYAGHGKRVAVTTDDGRRFHREALVPVDFARPPGPDQFLFDFELNERLRAIVARTTSVTVVLDCCHAAGVSRGTGLRTFFESGPVELPRERAIDGDAARHGLGKGVGACQVVSACLASELAHEDDTDGQPGGLLTRAFVAALDAAGAQDLRAITWAQIWEPIYARMARHSATQHPELAGNRGRLVFGGPPVDGDPGIAVSYDAGRDRYRIAAGSLADVTEDAWLAVYDRRTAGFPPRASAADHAARIGLLRVESAKVTTAIATAITPRGAPVRGKPFPPGARARLIATGQRARLRYGVTPGHPEIQFDSRLLERAPDGEPAPVRLELRGDRWLLTDGEHTVQDGTAVLCALRRDRIGRARAVLEHYFAYSLPLRIASRIAADREGGLQLTVLRCPSGDLGGRHAQPGLLPEATPGNGRYELVTGARVCFRVRNTAAAPQRVTLLNAAASGRVQGLGDEIIDPGADHVFWYESNLGVPFAMSPADGQRRGVDRVVAIGRSDLGAALDHLTTEVRFADLVQTSWLPTDVVRRDMSPPPAERWTAALAVIDTRDASEWPSAAPGA